jgi:hypothetical protein
MNLISIKLQFFLGESLSPHHLIGFELTPDEIVKWNTFLKTEVSSIKRRVANFDAGRDGKRELEIAVHINQLVRLSNVVYSFLNKSLPVWKNHSQAMLIRAQYLHTCQVLEDLIDYLSDTYPLTKRHIRITNYNLPQTKMAMRHRYSLLIKHLKRSAIDPELFEQFVFAIRQIINEVELTTSLVAYINRLIDLILNQRPFDNQRLQHFLIVNDFNAPEFFHYCIGKWRTALIEIPGLQEQQEYILREKDLLFNTHLEKGIVMPIDGSNLYSDLDNFLSEKRLLLKGLVKIRRQALRDSNANSSWPRVLIDLPVPMFGLFIRMQIEKGWFGKEHIGELFTFFAKHFYTPHTYHMSPESLQKKSTDVEFSTAKKMKGHLISMINWLNTHYNLSNYN